MVALGGVAVAVSILATPVLAGFLAACARVVAIMALLVFCLGKRVQTPRILIHPQTVSAPPPVSDAQRETVPPDSGQLLSKVSLFWTTIALWLF